MNKQSIRVALIGSRKLEHHPDYSLYFRVCYRLAEIGVVGVSGLCQYGADACMQRAYSEAIADGKATLNQLEVYVVDEHSKQRSNLPNKEVAIIRNPSLITRTHEICLQVMEQSHWNNCSDSAKALHARNCHQILGYELDNPVDAVICWTPCAKEVGGTRTAIKLAKQANIPVFNLGSPDVKGLLSNIKDFLAAKNVIVAK